MKFNVYFLESGNIMIRVVFCHSWGIKLFLFLNRFTLITLKLERM